MDHTAIRLSHIHRHVIDCDVGGLTLWGDPTVHNKQTPYFLNCTRLKKKCIKPHMITLCSDSKQNRDIDHHMRKTYHPYHPPLHHGEYTLRIYIIQ